MYWLDARDHSAKGGGPGVRAHAHGGASASVPTVAQENLVVEQLRLRIRTLFYRLLAWP